MNGYRDEGERAEGRGHQCGCCCSSREREGDERRERQEREERPRAESRREEEKGAEGHGGGAGRGDGAAGVLGGANTGKTIGAGALIAAGVMLLAANRDKLKPIVKGTMKEYYRFSDWLGSNFAQVKEDLSDMAAEARHDYEREMAEHLELLEKERQLVQRLANMAKKRAEET